MEKEKRKNTRSERPGWIFFFFLLTVTPDAVMHSASVRRCLLDEERNFYAPFYALIRDGARLCHDGLCLPGTCGVAA